MKQLFMQVEDGSDSDFTILDDIPSTSRREVSPVRERKPFAGREEKPKIAKPAQYRHAIAREALTDQWEDEVEQMPERASELCLWLN